MQIAVVGAGIAGLSCARALLECGHRVTVFEAGDHPGGRVATMRSEIGSFDTGAQYFTARHPAFLAQTEAWNREGCVAPWLASLSTVGEAPLRPHSGAHPGSQTLRWVGTPTMSTIGLRLARDLDVRHGTWISRIDAVREHGAVRWSLQRRDTADAASIAVTEGLFDAVLVALPAARAASLLEVAPGLQEQAARARIEPCWALALGFVEPVRDARSALGDAAFVNRGRLAWIAREPSKPGRRVGERWTAHAQSAWSVEHFDDDPEDIKAKLVRAFQEATGSAEQPIYAHVVLWREALPRAWLSTDFLWDPERRIGACGDWCRGYRVEDAWLSGLALAGAVSAGESLASAAA